jgi:pyruvate dehydrogenase E1 component alpha subunit
MWYVSWKGQFNAHLTPAFFGGNGIVGAQVPMGVGVVFAQKYHGEKRCMFALYGDGANNQAKLWNLPCIFVCEKNKYGMGASSARSSSNTEYFTGGDKTPGLQVTALVHSA